MECLECLLKWHLGYSSLEDMGSAMGTNCPTCLTFCQIGWCQEVTLTWSWEAWWSTSGQTLPQLTKWVHLVFEKNWVSLWPSPYTQPIPTLEDLKKEGVNVKGFLSGKAALEQMWYPVNPKTLSNGVGYVRIFNQTVTTKPDLVLNRRMKAWDKWFNPT